MFRTVMICIWIRYHAFGRFARDTTHQYIDHFGFHLVIPVVNHLDLVARNPVFGVFRKSETQTSLLSYRD